MSSAGTANRTDLGELSSAPPEKRFRADVQGLRAIAVLAVIADHLVHWPAGGFVGVDVFFVISGFLITGLLVREYEQSGRISFVGFYARRIRRIIPAAVTVLLATVLASYLVLGRLRFIEVCKDAVYSMAFLANWRFADVRTDYFQSELPPSPLQHFWSLAVEEQFYVVWPWLLLGLLLLGARFFGLQRSRTRLVAGTIVVMIGVASFGWALRETATSSETAYFSTFSRGWELAVGALVAVLGSRLAVSSARLRRALVWLGLAGIGAALVGTSASGFPAPWAVLPVVATALVIAAGTGAGHDVYLLSNPVSQYIGEISYSLYLWHFPIIVLLAQVMRPGITYWFLGAALTLVLSAASYRFVEMPLRRGPWFRSIGRWWLLPASRRTIAFVGVAALAAVLSGCAYLATRVDVDHAVSAFDRRLDGYPGAAAVAEGVPVLERPLRPPADIAYEDLAPHTEPCMLGEAQTEATECELVSPNHPTAVVVLAGDSHARQWATALTAIARERDWRLLAYFRAGCRVAADAPDMPLDDACLAWGRNVQTEIQQLRPGAVVTVGTMTATDATPEFVPSGQVAAWHELDDAGIRTIALRDNPRFEVDPAVCAEFDPTGEGCGRPRADALAARNPLMDADGIPESTAIVDLSDYFCGPTTCEAVVGNVLVGRDAGHITNTYIRTLTPYLSEELSTAAPWLP